MGKTLGSGGLGGRSVSPQPLLYASSAGPAGGPPGSLSGAAGFFRIIYKYGDLANTDRGTDIGLGGAQFFELASDIPVDVFVNDGPEAYRKVTSLSLVMQISNISIRRRTAAFVDGAVRIRYGYPAEAAALLQPERDPVWFPALHVPVSGYTWPLSTAVTSPVGTTVLVPSALVTEACFVDAIYLARSSGTINLLRLVANVSGTVTVAEYPQASASSIYFEPRHPIKICSDWYAELEGSSEAGNTTVNGWLRFRRL